MLKVFLMDNVPALGKLGEQVLVPRGMARNMLFPRKMAVPVNPFTRANFDKIKAEAVLRNEQAIEKAAAISDKLEGVVIEFHENAHEDDDRLFGSVTARQIADGVSRVAGVTVSHDCIDLPVPLKALGDYEIKVLLHNEVAVSLLVKILRRGGQ